MKEEMLALKYKHGLLSPEKGQNYEGNNSSGIHKKEFIL